MVRTQLPGRPSRTCHTSTVYWDSERSGSRAAAGRASAQDPKSAATSAVASALPERIDRTKGAEAILADVNAGKGFSSDGGGRREITGENVLANGSVAAAALFPAFRRGVPLRLSLFRPTSQRQRDAADPDDA